MKRFISLTIIFVVFSVITLTPVSAEKATVTFWNGFTGPDRPAIESLVEKFNQMYPNIRIKMDIMSWDVLMQKLLVSMKVTGEPDIAGIHFQYLPQYAKGDLLMALDDLYTSREIEHKMFSSSLVEAMKWKDHIYAFPMNFATLMLYYNKDLFEEAGLNPENPPETWKEWQNAAIRLTKDIDGDGKPDQYGLVIADHATIPMWPILVWGNGSAFVSKNKTKSMLDDPRTIEAVDIWARMIIEHKISPVGLTGAGADKLVESGRAAMEMNGPWMTAGYTRAGLNYDVAPIPKGPAGRVTLADTVIVILNKITKNKDAAYEFFKFWNKKESQAYLSLNTGFPPTRVDMSEEPGLQKNPFVVKFAKATPYARFYLAGLEEFAKIDVDIIIPAIEKITRGLQPAHQALKEAAQKMNILLSE